VFFMQAGFAMLCVGSVRRKNAQVCKNDVTNFSGRVVWIQYAKYFSLHCIVHHVSSSLSLFLDRMQC